MTNRNQNGAKPLCDTCHGRGTKNLVVGFDKTDTKKKNHKTKAMKCHCVDNDKKKNETKWWKR